MKLLLSFMIKTLKYNFGAEAVSESALSCFWAAMYYFREMIGHAPEMV